MKRIEYLLIIAFAAAFLFNSCEETIVNPDLPYIEQLVIRAVLESGKPVTGVTISRTLPPLTEYTVDSAVVSNAEAIITYNGNEYKLSYDNSSKSYYNNALVPVTGGHYKLRVNWKGLSATGETTVPDSVSISSFSFKSVFLESDDYNSYYDYYLDVCFSPGKSGVFIGSINKNRQYYNYEDYCYRLSDTLKNGSIILPLYIDYFYYNFLSDTNEIKKNLSKYYAFIYSYDTPYYDYFLTRYEGGETSGDIFGLSGINVRGNIKGGIGLFIGKATTYRKIFFD